MDTTLEGASLTLPPSVSSAHHRHMLYSAQKVLLTLKAEHQDVFFSLFPWARTSQWCREEGCPGAQYSPELSNLMQVLLQLRI